MAGWMDGLIFVSLSVKGRYILSEKKCAFRVFSFIYKKKKKQDCKNFLTKIPNALKLFRAISNQKNIHMGDLIS